MLITNSDNIISDPDNGNINRALVIDIFENARKRIAGSNRLMMILLSVLLSSIVNSLILFRKYPNGIISNTGKSFRIISFIILYGWVVICSRSLYYH